MADSRVERTERLLNLVFCLMSARRAVSRSTIQGSVPGYGADQAPAAFERMFERDKDELRQMGIPIETVLDANGDVEGYRIRGDEYRLDPIAFTPDELRVIALAAQVWDEAILGPAALTALRKIEAAEGAGPATPGDLRMSVHVAAPDPALMPLLQAVRERHPVTFEYRGANDAGPARRRVDPWAVASRRGRWYVVGHDHDRGAPRSFRLSRICGPVTVSAAGQSVPRDPSVDVGALLEPGDPESPVRARVRLREGRAAGLRRLSTAPVPPSDAVECEVAASSRMQLIAAILGAGDGAEVLDPPDIRADVIDTLRRVAGAHGVGS